MEPFYFYNGNLLNGMFNGYGMSIDSKGTNYKGFWKDGVEHGKCKLVWI